MSNKLFSELAKIDEVTFYLLEHHIHVARLVRDAMTRRGLSNKEMAEILGVKETAMKKVLTGAYPFDLMLLSKLQSYNEIRAANDAKFKIKAETIRFADYEGMQPILSKVLHRIEEKLNKEAKTEHNL